MILESVITCPHCATAKSETMPTDACQFFYDLDERVRAYIDEHPEVPWDVAVAAIVKEGENEEDAD